MKSLTDTKDDSNIKDNIALGNYVHSLREANGWGLRDTARRAEVDATWLSRLEQGVYSSPDARSLLKLARALGVDVEELYVAAGLTDGRGLPSFTQYLHQKYDLPEVAVEQLRAHFELLNDKYVREGDPHANNTFHAS